MKLRPGLVLLRESGSGGEIEEKLAENILTYGGRGSGPESRSVVWGGVPSPDSRDELCGATMRDHLGSPHFLPVPLRVFILSEQYWRLSAQPQACQARMLRLNFLRCGLPECPRLKLT